jgi:hypothetical protein
MIITYTKGEKVCKIEHVDLNIIADIIYYLQREDCTDICIYSKYANF